MQMWTHARGGLIVEVGSVAHARGGLSCEHARGSRGAWRYIHVCRGRLMLALARNELLLEIETHTANSSRDDKLSERVKKSPQKWDPAGD